MSEQFLEVAEDKYLELDADELENELVIVKKKVKSEPTEQLRYEMHYIIKRLRNDKYYRYKDEKRRLLNQKREAESKIEMYNNEIEMVNDRLVTVEDWLTLHKLAK